LSACNHLKKSIKLVKLNKFKDLYSKKWIVTLPNNNVYEFKGKKEVKSFIEKYNIENKTKISFFSLFQYGKNGDGWVLKK
jgi:hypothetical protein